MSLRQHNCVNSNILHADWIPHLVRAFSSTDTYVTPSKLLCRYCFSLTDVADDYAAVAAGKLPKPKLGAFQVLTKMKLFMFSDCTLQTPGQQECWFADGNWWPMANFWQPKMCGCQVLHTVVCRAPAKEAAKAQAVLAPPLAKAAMEPAPDVREAALQASTAGGSTLRHASAARRYSCMSRPETQEPCPETLRRTAC